MAHRAGGSAGECPYLVAEVRGVEHAFRDGLGQPPGIGATAPDRGAFTPASGSPPRGPAKGVEANEVHQDCSAQRLIYKCRLDPSVDNSGYAGVVRVVRNGGSARIDGDTLVIENASSVMLLTRIEWFADYSEDQVEAVRQALERLNPDYSELLNRHQRSSRRCSTASLWISEAPRNMACPRRNSCPTRGRGPILARFA